MKIVESAVLLALFNAASAFVAPGLANGRATSTRIFVEDEPAAEIRGAEVISGLTSDVLTIFDSEAVDEAIPHRYPFNFVDKIVEYVPGKRAVGMKLVSKNEDFFNGHFPGRRVMPGVLQVEALAQLAGTVCLKMDGADPGSIFFFAGVDGVKWKRPVVPGDTLVMEVEILKFNKKFGIVKATGKGYVDGKIAIDVKEMTFALAK
mmetsp:Transcript_21908/g.28362  ORF Transcript_21908/g.28362 Transcript_21908/m.28362 type:complete len:205 (-) Transcript_21908:94-708(-)|eukprot:CAMPEP_0198136624 /NCGR_PEP_ID=MMETSP1443-20131203/264_1 /TAXON_ID=186043 /ORGANISM="Entomoneis sp., Strain CCMP2396" /LENGTH=204 /DNA_ID=CAMNT_0043797881 /DNA_START=49 /DNA_END=663 /DNA_ORIENTATION=+